MRNDKYRHTSLGNLPPQLVRRRCRKEASAMHERTCTRSESRGAAESQVGGCRMRSERGASCRAQKRSVVAGIGVLYGARPARRAAVPITMTRGLLRCGPEVCCPFQHASVQVSYAIDITEAGSDQEPGRIGG